MIDKILPLLSRYIPLNIAAKGLEKVDGRFGRFLQSSLAAGYTLDSAIDYLRDQFTSPSNLAEENRLSTGMQQGTLRPDERAAFSEQQREKQPMNVISNLAKLGGTGAAGLISQVMPSQDSQQPSEFSPTADNLLQQLAPQLHSFMVNNISQGRPVDQSAALAKLTYNKDISNLEKKLKKDWSVIANEAYEHLTKKQNSTIPPKPESPQQPIENKQPISTPKQNQESNNSNIVNQRLLNILNQLESRRRK